MSNFLKHVKLYFFRRNRGNRGIFPKSYIELMECVRSKNDYVIKRSEIVDEITTVLVEWGDLFKKFYLVICYANFFGCFGCLPHLKTRDISSLNCLLPFSCMVYFWVDADKQQKFSAYQTKNAGTDKAAITNIVRQFASGRDERGEIDGNVGDWCGK